MKRLLISLSILAALLSATGCGASVRTAQTPDASAQTQETNAPLTDEAADPESALADEAADPESALAESVRAIAWPYYAHSGELLANNPYGRYFTDHKSAHASLTCEKALEAGEAISQAVLSGALGASRGEGRVALGAGIDRATLLGAALCHDIGMSGGGYVMVAERDGDGNDKKDANGNTVYERDEQGAYVLRPENDDDFGEVRGNHSFVSALYVFANRQGLRDAGYSDEQIDKMALACMAHSKSASGVRDLNSAANWTECFDRLDALVLAWNRDRADAPISFDRTPFESDAAKLGALASETLALRIGDVSRDSGPDAEAQSGETVHVERDTLNDRGGSIPAEVENAVITIGGRGDPVESEKSKQVHVGEQNIRDNHTYADGGLVHEITVIDGCSAPRCTQQAIDDHLGEFYSARDEQFEVRVLFDRFDAEDAAFFRESWEDFRTQAAQDYPTVSLAFPWDSEEAAQ